MSVHITNVSSGPVSVELNTGDTVHLAPGETSRAVGEYEVGDNTWIRMLRDRGHITLNPAAEAAQSGRKRPHRDKDDSPAS